MILRRRRQRRAYYNDVPFFMEMDEIAGGHRVVKHEFPYQKDPFTEDLGLKGKEYSILGFLAGQNYKENKTKLIAQLEKPDEIGVLKHPYVGTLNVRCSNFRVIEINSEVGFIRVQMLFMDAGVPYVQVKAAPVWALGQKIGDALTAGYNFIANNLTSGEDAFEAYLDTLNSYTEALEDKMVPFMRIREGFEGLRVTIDQNKEALAQITSEPGKLWESILNVFKTPEKFVTPDIFVSILLSRFPGVPLSPIEAARIAVASEVISKTQINDPKNEQEIKDQFVTLVDQFLYGYPPVELFESIRSLKMEMMKHFQELESKRNFVSFSQSFETNSILLTYDLYGDLAHEHLICSANKIQNPSRIHAGERLQVPAYE